MTAESGRGPRVGPGRLMRPRRPQSPLPPPPCASPQRRQRDPRPALADLRRTRDVGGEGRRLDRRRDAHSVPRGLRGRPAPPARDERAAALCDARSISATVLTDARRLAVAARAATLTLSATSAPLPDRPPNAVASTGTHRRIGSLARACFCSPIFPSSFSDMMARSVSEGPFVPKPKIRERGPQSLDSVRGSGCIAIRSGFAH